MDLEFIKKLADKMEKQNNRCTQYPLFYVYETREIWVNEDNYDRIGFINEEGEEVKEIQDENDETWKLEEDNYNSWICLETEERIDSFEVETKFGLRTVYIKEESIPVVTVGPFFTEEAAAEHIKANSYHYKDPYIYVDSCWRNYEMQAVMHKIFELAGKEIPNQYK